MFDRSYKVLKREMLCFRIASCYHWTLVLLIIQVKFIPIWAHLTSYKVTKLITTTDI